MKKKAYISPETEVVRIKIEHLLVDVSSGTDDVHSDGTPDTTGGDNRSRRRRDVWEDEEEEDW